MSLIKNLIKEPTPEAVKDGEPEPPKVRNIIKTATDLQRLKLEKLMRDPSKPIIIPETRKEKDYMQSVPTFVRNVMGSSAGAGSGEFHVYRHLRRKEYARQKTIQAKSIKEQLDEEYQHKLDENRRLAEEKTAKKRAKRLKKKQRAKRARKSGKAGGGNQKEAQANEDDSSDGEETQTDESDKEDDVKQNDVREDIAPRVEKDKIEGTQQLPETVVEEQKTLDTQNDVTAQLPRDSIEISETSKTQSQAPAAQSTTDDEEVEKSTVENQFEDPLPQAEEIEKPTPIAVENLMENFTKSEETFM